MVRLLHNEILTANKLFFGQLCVVFVGSKKQNGERILPRLTLHYFKSSFVLMQFFCWSCLLSESGLVRVLWEWNLRGLQLYCNCVSEAKENHFPKLIQTRLHNSTLILRLAHQGNNEKNFKPEGKKLIEAENEKGTVVSWKNFPRCRSSRRTLELGIRQREKTET